MTFDQGSFRDRRGRVFYHQGEVYRTLNPVAQAEWQALEQAKFFTAAVEAGQVVATRSLPQEDWPDPAAGSAAVLWHEKIPFVSYPYEWPFSMLRQAGLLQLELLQKALKQGFIMRDASAYNVQWRGVKPTFIDIPSFARLAPGEPWEGYRQFCQHFLNPLLLLARRDVPYAPWLRGCLEGISAEHTRRLLGWKDLLVPGVFTHVVLHSSLQQSQGARQEDLRQEMAEAGFHAELIAKNVEGLHKLLRRLEWKAASSTWSGYESEHNYSNEDEEKKRQFVRKLATSKRWKLVWDLGCNLGQYSLIAAESADTVVSMDGDPLVIDRLYHRLRDKKVGNVLPLVMDLSDPSPDQGWRLAERKSLAERGRPELTLCLALMHHLVISANLPVASVLDWLAELETAAVIEFVTREDSMVKRLLANREDQYDDYNVEPFEKALEERFAIVERLELASRILYSVAPVSS
ncbi:MAG: methyltransferase, partial [Candidatus Eremiobacteraeota bacterium]|nr:methyltransferase [Candidatus Eremiobacteraeota bacterium]